MKALLRLEQVGLFVLGLYLFLQLPFAWWWFPLLLLAPDLGALGYLVGARVGAYSYNLTHHQGLAIGLYLLGAFLAAPILQLIGVIMLSHSGLDRAVGYGLKHSDSFHHTHLGWIGPAKERAKAVDHPSSH